MRLVNRILLSVLGISAILVLLVELMPTRWLASQVEARASARLGLPLRIGQLSVDLFSLTPGLRLYDTRINTHPVDPALHIDEARMEVSLPALLNGDFVVDDLLVDGGRAIVRIEPDGRCNWQALLSRLDDAAKRHSAGIPLPIFNRIRLRNVLLDYNDIPARRHARLGLLLSGSTAYPADPTAFSLSGRINGVPTALEGAINNFSVWPPERINIEVGGELGNNRLAMDGSFNQTREAVGYELNFDVDVEDTHALTRLVHYPLPRLPTFSLSGQLVRNEAEVVLRNIAGHLGQSDIEGDVRVDLTSRPASLIANLLSRQVDLRDVAAVAGSVFPDRFPSNSTSIQQAELNTYAVLWTAAWPRLLRQSAASVNGLIDYHVAAVQSSIFPASDYAMHIKLGSEAASIRAREFAPADGSARMDIKVDFSTPHLATKVTAALDHLRLELKPDNAGEGDDAAVKGALGGRANVRFEHDFTGVQRRRTDGTVSLLASTDDTRALMEIMAGTALVTSIGALQPASDLGDWPSCLYFDRVWTKGDTVVKRALIDTPDTVFVLGDVLDDNSRSINFSIAPLRKRLSPPYDGALIRVKGSLDAPSTSLGRPATLAPWLRESLVESDTAAAALMPYVQSADDDGFDACADMPDNLRRARQISHARRG